MLKRWKGILVLFTGLLVGLLFGAGILWAGGRTNLSGKPPPPVTGKSVQDFTLTDLEGNKVRLSDFLGKPVVLNFWATWCPPCRAEMPAIEKMYQEYKDQGFTVLAVDMTYQDDPFAIVPFTKEHSLTFPTLIEETGEVASAYQLRSLPSSYFINRAGIITEVVIGGPMSEALLRTRIEKILQ